MTERFVDWEYDLLTDRWVNPDSSVLIDNADMPWELKPVGTDGDWRDMRLLDD